MGLFGPLDSTAENGERDPILLGAAVRTNVSFEQQGQRAKQEESNPRFLIDHELHEYFARADYRNFYL